MKELFVVMMVLFAAYAFAQKHYSIGDVDVNEDMLYIDADGTLITGIIKDSGIRYGTDSLYDTGNFEYRATEYDVTKGKVTNTRFFNDAGLLVGEGMFDGEAFNGLYYIYREDGSLRFRLMNENGMPTKGWCVQGRNQRELSVKELTAAKPPECK